MNVQRIWITGLSCILATILILTGCMAPAKTVPDSRQAVVPADAPGAMDALERLTDEFKAGAGLSSQDSAELRQKRDEIVSRLDETVVQVKQGLYQDALVSLDEDIAEELPNW